MFIKEAPGSWGYCLGLVLWSSLYNSFEDQGDVSHFVSSPKYSLKVFVLQKSHFLWEFQAETLYGQRVQSFSLTPVLTDFLTSWSLWNKHQCHHYNDVIMGVMASQITSLTIVYSTVYLGADQRKDQSSASLAFVLGIHRWLVNSPHRGPVTWKMFPFDDVIMFDSNAFKNDFSKMLTILYRRQWVCSCNDGNILCWKTHFLYNCELTMTADIFCTIISWQ